MDEISALLIAKALDGLAMRASATAQNIANANSPGYSPVSVTFEGNLKAAAKFGAPTIREVRPELVRALTGDGASEVRLDLEMATASQTALRFSALIDVLSRQMQINRLIVTGGGR